MLFRIILWGLIIYLVLKAIKYFNRVLNGPAERNKNIENEEQTNVKNKPYSIDQKDIVDAKFEEIKEKKDDKARE